VLQLPIKTQDQKFKDESEAPEGVNDSEHSSFYRFQLNETVDCEKPYLDDSNSISVIDLYYQRYSSFPLLKVKEEIIQTGRMSLHLNLTKRKSHSKGKYSR